MKCPKCDNTDSIGMNYPFFARIDRYGHIINEPEDFIQQFKPELEDSAECTACGYMGIWEDFL